MNLFIIHTEYNFMLVRFPQETVASSVEVGDDLEQVEGVQRKFDDFQKVSP
jgi:hypothetical protein